VAKGKEREMSAVVLQTNLKHWPVRRGKVRDVYDRGDAILLVSTDRISAFDWVMPNGIPDKGRLLTGLSEFWFGLLGEANHLITTDVDAMSLPSDVDRELLRGRTMQVRKSEVVPFECVVRGYLAGSGWKEYRQSQAVCGVSLPSGLGESDVLPAPIFTPATKAESGHDENVSFDQMASVVGRDVADVLRRRSIAVYERGALHARQCGIIIADTKFEWGRAGNEFILIDEVLTPDSSRFWPADRYAPVGPQASFDKQFVRDWLETSGWDKSSPPPRLPESVVEQTRAKYVEAYERLTGSKFSE
jgi:phosphoribosylaminoimidazole-succinocarboxamide synthase